MAHAEQSRLDRRDVPGPAPRVADGDRSGRAAAGSGADGEDGQGVYSHGRLEVWCRSGGGD